MVDHLKILSFDAGFAQDLYDNPLLKVYSKNQKFSNKLDKENGSIKSTFIKSYKEILFCFFTKDELFTKLEILIKPHYYFNDNLHNANDFSALDSIKTLTEIKNIFNFPADELIILNIEFGLNAISPIDSKDLILCAIYHEKNEFINSSDSLKFSKISFKHHKSGTANKYKQIKFYAKGLQFPMYTDINTFRFEVKSKERKYIKKIGIKTPGIKTYADLLKVETYNKLAEIIKLEFKNVLILDISNKGQNLKNKELLKFNSYLNTITWAKSLQGSRNLFNKYKIEYFKLLDQTENNIHNKLNSIIDKKLKELLKPCVVSTTLKKEKPCAISDVYIIGNCTQNKIRKCEVTGLNISMQRSDSFLLADVGLRYYLKTDVKIYNEVKRKYLSKKWVHVDAETEIKEIYHNIRNTISNQRIKQNRIYTPTQFQLFDIGA